MTKFTLGVNNCFAIKRFPEPEVWVELVASDLDLNVVQYSYDLLDPRTYQPALKDVVSLTRDALARYGVVVHSCLTGLAMYCSSLLAHPVRTMRIDGMKWYERGIMLASKLNAKGTGGHIGSLSNRDNQDDEKRKNLEISLMKSLSRLAELAFKRDQEFFLWEPMAVSREPPCTISDAKRLLEEVNRTAKIPIQLCIDTGHQCSWDVMSRNDLDIYCWLGELAQESPVIHIQQTDGKGDTHWPFTEEYNRIGIIRPDKIMDAVEKSGAKECLLALEIVHPFESDDAKVVKDLKTSVEYWKEYL